MVKFKKNLSRSSSCADLERKKDIGWHVHSGKCDRAGVRDSVVVVVVVDAQTETETPIVVSAFATLYFQCGLDPGSMKVYLSW